MTTPNNMPNPDEEPEDDEVQEAVGALAFLLDEEREVDPRRIIRTARVDEDEPDDQ